MFFVKTYLNYTMLLQKSKYFGGESPKYPGANRRKFSENFIRFSAGSHIRHRLSIIRLLAVS